MSSPILKVLLILLPFLHCPFTWGKRWFFPDGENCGFQMSLSLHLLALWHWASWAEFSRSVGSNSLRPHGLQHARPPCPSPTPILYSNSCPLSGWGHPAISSSVVPFSSCVQSLPASGSFPRSQVFASSTLPMCLNFSIGKIGIIIAPAPHRVDGRIKWLSISNTFRIGLDISTTWSYLYF